MARRNELLVPQAQYALEQLKMETAQELGLMEKIQQVGWGDMTTREVGAIGGHMVKKMINAAEASLVEGAITPQRSGVIPQDAEMAKLAGPPIPSITRLNDNPF